MGAQVPRALPAQLPIQVLQVAQVPPALQGLLLRAQQVLEEQVLQDIEGQRGMQVLVVAKVSRDLQDIWALQGQKVRMEMLEHKEILESRVRWVGQGLQAL
jgi:anaerobic glycerol-3-phosphate dehydrogenase